MNNAVNSRHLKRSSLIKNFDQASACYHQQAQLQRGIADRLIASLEPWINIVPPGPILELGCGTGFVSQQLPKLFPKRPIQITDISPKMLERCQQEIKEDEYVSFQLLDANQIPVDEPTYGMTIHNFVAQWLKDPAYIMGQWLEASKPGGLLLAAFPGNQSFPDWKKYTAELGIPYTGNALPDTEEIVVKLSSDITQVDYYEDTVIQEFDRAVDFFHHLKQTGAGMQKSGRHLTPKELNLLMKHWDDQAEGKIKVKYHIIFLAVKREY